jgi:meso-butanediol dehydrogenase/(S,S)-butanediol dehydrogenase/diacetyl reductase
MTQQGYEGLRGKVCVVTGAAQGIGRGIATRLADEGCMIVFADINALSAEEAASKVRASGGRAMAVHVDVSERDSVRELVRRTVDEFGALNVMFNNAGITHGCDFLDLQESDFNRVMKVNGLGVLFGIQEAAKQMIAQGSGGKIINTNSQAGKTAWPDYTGYCASKFVVSSLTQSGARALAKHHITVNSFAPGLAHTPIWDVLESDALAAGQIQQKGEMVREFEKGILLGRGQEPAEFGGIACYLASDDSDWITGQTIMVDGGMVFL